MSGDIDRILNIKVKVVVRVGRTKALIGDMLKWGQGTIIELDRDYRDPVDIFVEGHLIASGEVVSVGDKYGVRITKLFDKSKDDEDDYDFNM